MNNSVKKQKNKVRKFEFFDNCPICNAMKEADEEGRSLSEKELRAAFNQAEKLRK